MPLILVNKTVFFYGEVGAGKTTLIKCLVKHLGSNNTVNSPTFSLVNIYDSDFGEIYHYDLYRLNTEEETLDIDILDVIDKEYICFIEWPQLIETYVSDFLKIEIKKISEKERNFRIFKN